MKKKKKWIPLLLKSSAGILMTAIVFTAVLVSAIYFYIKKTVILHYEKTATELAQTIALTVDGDELEVCAETGEKTAYYESLFSKLRETMAVNSNVKYIYLEQLHPEQNYSVVIMDTDPEKPIQLGQQVEFLDENRNKPLSDLLLHPYTSNTEYGWLCTVSAPIYNSRGEYAADVSIDMSMDDLTQQIRVILLKVLTIAFVIALVIVAGADFMMNHAIVKPITKLSSAASCYDSGMLMQDFSSELSRLSNPTGDEIEDLTFSVQKMETDIKHYVRDLTEATAANERVSAELNIATNIQAAMLPSVFPAFPDRQDFDLYASMHPAKEVGGDFYDYFLLDYDHLAFIAADVSGKGVPAALFMVVAKTLIRNQAQFGLPPEKVFSKVNMQLCENNKGGMFVTAWMGVLELSSGKVIFANAGHTRPVLAKADGTCEYVRSRAGFVLAGMEMMQYKQGELQLDPGDTLFLYTDGVTEATNAQNELYGEPRLLETIQTNPTAEPQEMIAAVKESIDGFVLDAPQFDDITMLAIRYKGEGTNMYTETKTFIAVKSELNHVLEWLDALLEKYECPMKTQTQLDIAVEEIFINVASYAYPQGTSTCDITCHFSGTPTKLEITFADKGVPYDPLKKKDPNVALKLEDREAGGLGIFMVKQSMEDMRYKYENGQNILTIVKTL